MTTPTPHPLAVEAAEKISKLHQEWFYQDELAMPDMAPLIHTTALEPVIKAGEEMEKSAIRWMLHLEDLRLKHCNDHVKLHAAEDALKETKQAILTWRTLTTAKTGNPTPLAGSRSDFPPQSGITKA